MTAVIRDAPSAPMAVPRLPDRWRKSGEKFLGGEPKKQEIDRDDDDRRREIESDLPAHPPTLHLHRNFLTTFHPA
jgi:hypothetical protein